MTYDHRAMAPHQGFKRRLVMLADELSKQLPIGQVAAVRREYRPPDLCRDLVQGWERHCHPLSFLVSCGCTYMILQRVGLTRRTFFHAGTDSIAFGIEIETKPLTRGKGNPGQRPNRCYGVVVTGGPCSAAWMR